MRQTIQFRLWLALCIGAALPGGTIADAGRLEDQRAVFINAWAAAERGTWALSKREEALLGDYVLWPDLRGRYLERQLARAPRDEVRAFLDRFSDSSAARALRYRLAKDRYRRNDWAGYLDIYDAHYSALDDTRLDCMAVTAQIRAGRTVNGALATALWEVGRSQPEECDPVFEWLTDSGLLDAALLKRRFDLALANHELKLAAWIARRLGPDERALAAAWQAMREDPRRELSRYESLADTADERRRIAWGVGRLARDDTDYAHRLWQTLQSHFDFDPATRASVGESIALVAAWRHQPIAGRLIASVDAQQRSEELLAWQVRAALRGGDWQQVLSAIALMPADMAAADGWRYWRARALAEIGAAAEAEELLAQTARNRSFYGFLAADALDLPYEFSHAPLAEDPDAQRRLRETPAVVRARELYMTGLSSRARSEWNAFTETLGEHDKAQAALLAHDWEWHSRAIATAASGGHFDDLELRYPLPWQEWFENYARDARIDTSWAYGIARSESLFMQDVRSHAGAVGLMQLMPATGRSTARAARYPYRGLETLTDPRSNIILGTRYLGTMYERFGRNQVLATAAYNAGPHRVERWLPDDAALPADVWIETIPFDETRKYVQRVLEADTVFHWRLTQRVRRVSSVLDPIGGPVRQAAASPGGVTAGR